MNFFGNLSIAKRLISPQHRRRDQSAAAGTQEVSSNFAGVTQAASETGGAADGVLGATK